MGNSSVIKTRAVQAILEQEGPDKLAELGHLLTDFADKRRIPGRDTKAVLDLEDRGFSIFIEVDETGELCYAAALTNVQQVERKLLK